MRALLLPLALLAAVAAVAVPAAALPVDCSERVAPASWLTCHRLWAEVDAGFCLRQADPAACLQDEGFDCTLDAPPSRCGNHIVGFGFRGA